MLLKTSFCIITLFGFLFCAKTSLAREACNDGSPVTADIMNCLMIDYEKSNKQLNTLYHTIIQNLSVPEQKQLKSSQIKWIKSKDECNRFYNEMEYGHEGRFSVVVCQTQKTDSRIKYLTIYQQCYQVSSQHSNIKSCLWDEYQKLDQQLNLVYKQVLSKSSNEKQKDIKKDEREWIKEKDIACNKYKNINDKNSSKIECLIERTQEQVSILESQLKENE
ncbi:lysozyme inhibitor LprI family protein [Commensalibacter communis]|uniref:lysozyme inhibitor LprI family protein n=1 Tax=Commensalibacter communis TaxID=2972786 RepID=UPI0022FF6D93|nr:lysozyme inhibitor LprI family protein [Commensalibacter communis]CAI3936369.1 unnamed protein product [Commensalibacter communis]CAI3941769.1 unnamed protein product [Commensalibacter communis]